MGNTRKISPAKRPFNPTYEDTVAAIRSEVHPLLKEIFARLDALATKPQLLNYNEIRLGYGFSRHQIQKFVRLGLLKKVGTGRPRFPRKDLDNLIQGYEVKMSKV